MRTRAHRGGRANAARRFARSQRGAVGTWFAIVLVPMLGFVFAAIKFTEYSAHRAGMHDAIDAAGLGVVRHLDLRGYDVCAIAAAQEGDEVSSEARRQHAELLRYGYEMFAENYPEHTQLYADRGLAETFDPAANLDFTFDCQRNKLVATARPFADMGGVLGRFFGVGALPLDLLSEISLPGNGKIELALVLDYSGSMAGGKIGGLKNAVRGMLDELYGAPTDSVNEDVKTAIVPFNSFVNVKPSAFPSGAANKWLDTQARALWHGRSYLHVEQTSVGTPAERLVAGGRPVNHFRLFDSLGAAEPWAGCVEQRPFPLDELPHPPGTSFPGSAYDAALSLPAGLSFPTGNDYESQVRTYAQDAWSSLRDPGSRTLDDDPAAPSRVPGTTYRDLVTGSADSTRFVPLFNGDDPDCEGMSDCDLAVLGVPSGVAGYVSDAGASHLLSPPPALPAGETLPQRGFLDDANWIYPGGSGSEPYFLALLDYVNSVGRGLDATGEPGADADCYVGADGFFGGADAPDGALVRAARWFGALPCAGAEPVLRRAYVGVWDQTTQRYRRKYDAYDPSSRTSAEASVGVGPNYTCAPPIEPLTTDKRRLWTHINTHGAGGATNSAIGMMWGWHLLSPEAPYPGAADPATRTGREWRKFAVLMSDGQNNITYSGTYGSSQRSAWGLMDEDRLFLREDSDADWKLKERFDLETDRKTIRICHRMRAEGIKVYTIGYGIDKNSRPEKMLKACALEKDAYFAAKDADEIEDVFEEITAMILDMHVSR